MEHVELDGGRGGGQLLRTALCLSLVTGRPFTLSSFRARATGPGFRPRHLASVRAAESLGGRADGTSVDGERLSFTPGPVRAGEHVIDLGAGTSGPAVWPALFYPLALAGGGELTLRGATHLTGSVTYPYLRSVWMAGAAAFGFRASLFLKSAGFAPEGSGEFRGLVAPALSAPERVTLPSRGTLREVEVTSYVAGLPLELAERQGRAAVYALREQGIAASPEHIPVPSSGAGGMALFIRASFEHTVAGFTAVGERSASPEEVGRSAAAQLAAFMALGGAVDEHLAAQLLVPAGLLAAGLLPGATRGTSRFTAARLTEGARSTARCVEAFLPVRVALDEGAGEVTVSPG